MIQLSDIHQPSDIRALSTKECMDLADDIRTKIIQTVSQNGGHLSSNLGVVEMTMALHRVFDSPTDRFVFDVGHQSYVHKLLTGRFDQFDTLRKYGGISGFTRPEESEHDCFEVGHASTAISSAVGLARARDAMGKQNHVIALVGDGALTGGMCYEALNDCGNDKTKIIIVLNDNEMSIARNVGALSKHLSKLRASKSWNVTKRKVKATLKKLPAIGHWLTEMFRSIKKSLKSLVVDEGFFNALGFRYLGPIDGHDLDVLEDIFRLAQSFEEPVVVHCATKKGYGYNKAEKRPEVYHGTPPFLIENGAAQKSSTESFGRIAVDTLVEQAKEDERIAVVTAAMPLGTATDRFQHAFPERFFDVGIAEEHAVTMCGGMAKGGMHPFFFVYSTFLQRGYDQVMHDVCMQGLPVVFLLDRAGLSNEDGKSHQGLFDIAYLRSIPGITLLAPASSTELREMVRAACAADFPCAIRYPKNAVRLGDFYENFPFVLGKWQRLFPGQDGTILAVGTMVRTALSLAEKLKETGIALEVVNASTVKPLDAECLLRLAEKKKPVFTIEEHALAGGFGSAVLEWASEHHPELTVHPFGVRDEFIPHGDHKSLLKHVGLDEETLIQRIQAIYAEDKAQ